MFAILSRLLIFGLALPAVGCRAIWDECERKHWREQQAFYGDLNSSISRDARWSDHPDSEAISDYYHQTGRELRRLR